MRAFALAVLLVALAPASLAQEPFVVAADAPALLVPGADEVRVAVRAIVPCALVGGADAFVVDVAQAPRWIVARVEPARVPAPSSCDDEWSPEAGLFLSAAPYAPGLKEEPVLLSLFVGGHERGLSVPVRAAFVPALLVEADDTPKSAPPQDVITFAIQITNAGNAVTKITIDAVATGEFMATSPAPVTLQSPRDGGRETTMTIPLTVMTPYRTGRVDEGGVVTVRLTPAYALDPSMFGKTQTLTFQVHSMGFYAPGMGAGAAVALVGLAAALRPRRD